MVALHTLFTNVHVVTLVPPQAFAVDVFVHTGPTGTGTEKFVLRLHFPPFTPFAVSTGVSHWLLFVVPHVVITDILRNQLLSVSIHCTVNVPIYLLVYVPCDKSPQARLVQEVKFATVHEFPFNGDCPLFDTQKPISYLFWAVTLTVEYKSNVVVSHDVPLHPSITFTDGLEIVTSLELQFMLFDAQFEVKHDHTDVAASTVSVFVVPNCK